MAFGFIIRASFWQVLTRLYFSSMLPPVTSRRKPRVRRSKVLGFKGLETKAAGKTVNVDDPGVDDAGETAQVAEAEGISGVRRRESPFARASIS